MNIKQIVKKTVVAGATLALLGVAAMPAAASALAGTFTDKKIQNTGETGLATNLNFTNISSGEVKITNWGSGWGDVRMSLQDSTGTDEYTHRFTGKGTWNILEITPTSYPYNLWATNTRSIILPGTGDRIISGSWDFA
ncbi:MAG: hypothetical protein PUC41_07205 [Oscillospiraceae bacterium]|nr:hypothetical protein [Oscillospiraceae bacterium]